MHLNIQWSLASSLFLFVWLHKCTILYSFAKKNCCWIGCWCCAWVWRHCMHVHSLALCTCSLLSLSAMCTHNVAQFKLFCFLQTHLTMCIFYSFAIFFVGKLGIGVVHYWGVQYWCCIFTLWFLCWTCILVSLVLAWICSFALWV